MSFIRNVGVVEDAPIVHRTLPGGTNLLVERVEGIPSLALGVWVRSGSRHEEPEQAGIAHFLEHVVFKGTRRQSALQIAKRLEALGGQVDAFTSRETTCFHARVFEGNRKATIQLLGEILTQAAFRKEMIDRERLVVEEEILGYEDSPEELAFDVGAELIWQGHPLANSILGTFDTLSRIGSRELRRFHREHYTPENVMVTVAGRVDPDRVEEDVVRSFRLPKGPSPNGKRRLPPFRQRVRHLERDIGQTSICLISRAASSLDRRRHAQAVLHTILGSGVSSRLFQRIREEEALAYSVYTYLETLRDTGLFAIYLGVEPKNTRRATALVCRELRRLRRHGVKKWELDSAKAQILTSIFLAHESMYERMSRLAMDHIYYGRVQPVSELVSEVESVTAEDVEDEAERLLDPARFCLVTIGPKGHERPKPSDLEF